MPGFEFLRSIFENNQLVVDRKQKLSICKAGTNHSTNRKSPTRKPAKEFVCFVKVFKTSPIKVIVHEKKNDVKSMDGVSMLDSLSVLVALSNLSAF